MHVCVIYTHSHTSIGELTVYKEENKKLNADSFQIQLSLAKAEQKVEGLQQLVKAKESQTDLSQEILKQSMAIMDSMSGKGDKK